MQIHHKYVGAVLSLTGDMDEVCAFFVPTLLVLASIEKKVLTIKCRTIMSKKILFQFMTCLIVCLSAFFSSCSKDDNDDELEQTTNVSSQDPEGTIVLNMTSGSKDNWHKIGDLGEIHIDAANNFVGRNSDYRISFVSVGLVSGLSKITQIPTSGWAESAAVVPGTGYLMRKPERDMVDEILNRMGIKTEDAVYIGDSNVDVETAVNSEMDFIGVSWGFRGRKKLEEYGVKTIADIPEDLLKILL